MTGDDAKGLRDWMESRFDRIDMKVDEKTSALSDEIKQTRHGFRPVLEQLAIQLAELVTTSRQHDREIAAVNEWRADDGPLDLRFKRHSARHEEQEKWRNTIRGALIVASLFIPIVTGVTTGLVVGTVLQLT